MQKNKYLFLNHSKTIILSVFFLFPLILSISLLSILHGNFFIEIFKNFQFLLLLLLVYLLSNKINKFLNIIVLAFLFFVNYLFLLYHFQTSTKLDFFFLKSIFKDLPSLAGSYSAILIIIFLISLANSYFILKVFKILNTYSIKSRSFLIIPFFFITFFSPINQNNELIFFTKSIFQNNKIISYYQNFYNQQIQTSIHKKQNLITQAQQIKNENIPPHLENIIILQLESLNSFLVNTSTTPNFLEISKKGIYFPKTYGNSVQTILGQENILCSLPSSFNKNLVQSGLDKEIICLPEILNNIDYKTFFLKSYDLNFTQTGTFMKHIGFNEVHADSIMEKTDPQYYWGYREDIFYKKSFEHLKQNKQDKYNFAYIEVGPTNHWPFNTPKDLQDEVPFKQPKNHREKLINTTFLQDKYLGLAWEELNNTFPNKNYSVIIVGDHSWPAEIHAGNNFNQKNSFEENFLTSMIYIQGNSTSTKNRIINTKYSLMDITPSILDMFNLDFMQNDFRTSFWNEINNNNSTKDKTILIQPYSERHLNIINNTNKKYFFNSSNNSLKTCELDTDPLENNCTTLNNNTSNIKKLLPLLNNEKIIMHALGGINNDTLTNSKEAFCFNYNKGRKIFEVDLSFTIDDQLVAHHGTNLSINKNEFLKNNNYTLLGLDDILYLLKEHDDIFIVTDTKNNFKKSFQLIIDKAKGIDETLLKQIIPQIYTEEDYFTLSKLYNFDKIIYTQYKNNYNDDKIFNFINQNKNIKILAVNESRFSKKLTKELNDIGVETFVHTLNKEDKISNFLKNGTSGIYTDFY